MSLVAFQLHSRVVARFWPKTLKWKDGKLYAYPVQNKWAARGPQCVLRTLSIVHLRCLFYVNLVGRANVVCFVSLLIHRAIHTRLWTSQTLADHEQGAWSATAAHSLVKWCVHFIVPLFGNAQYGIAYFLFTRNILIFQKSHSPNWSP